MAGVPGAVFRLEADRVLAEGIGDVAGGVVIGRAEELPRGVGHETLPARIDRPELREVLHEQPELRAVAAQQGDAVGQAVHPPELTELIEEECDPVLRLPGCGGNGIEGQADEPPHEAQAGAQPVGRDGEIDRHLPVLQIRAD